MPIRTATGWAPMGKVQAKSISAVFNPLSIAWHTAYWASNPAQSFVDGAVANPWNDASGNGRTLTNAGLGGVYDPHYRASVTGMNNRPAVQFDGSANFLGTYSPGAFSALSPPASLFVVLKQSAVNAGTYKVPYDSVTNGRGFSLTTNYDANWTPGAGGAYVSLANAPDTTAHSMMTLWTGAVASNSFLIDGSVIGSTYTFGGNTIIDILLGCFSGGTNFWGGHIAFYGIKASAFTTPEKTALIAWSKTFYATP